MSCMQLHQIVNLEKYPLDIKEFGLKSREELDSNGVLVLPGFLRTKALNAAVEEALAKQEQAYFCVQQHSVYLTPPNTKLPPEHPFNRQIESSKGCICHDQIAKGSPLSLLYEDPVFQGFVKTATGQSEVFPYADTLSSINVHYANRGQELGWHFDNSSFAITLLLQKPDSGGTFEYVPQVRSDTMTRTELESSYQSVSEILDGGRPTLSLTMDPGTLVLFRGKHSLHRVSPNTSDRTRILAVLAYNERTGVSLSESARKTFFGRLS